MEQRNTASSALLASAGLLIIGAFLPWATVSGQGISVSVNGLQGSDGYLTILAGALLGFVGYKRMKGEVVPKGLRIGSYIAVGVALALGLMNYSSIDDVSGAALLTGVDAGAGIGLWLTIIGGFAGLAGVLMARKDPGPTMGGGTTTTETWDRPSDTPPTV